MTSNTGGARQGEVTALWLTSVSQAVFLFGGPALRQNGWPPPEVQSSDPSSCTRTTLEQGRGLAAAEEVQVLLGMLNSIGSGSFSRTTQYVCVVVALARLLDQVEMSLLDHVVRRGGHP